MNPRVDWRVPWDYGYSETEGNRNPTAGPNANHLCISAPELFGSMYCRVAQDLLDDYITAAKRHGDAAIDVLESVGTEEFMDAKARVEHSRALARAALLALENHRKEHNCGSLAWPHKGALS